MKEFTKKDIKEKIQKAYGLLSEVSQDILNKKMYGTYDFIKAYSYLIEFMKTNQIKKEEKQGVE